MEANSTPPPPPIEFSALRYFLNDFIPEGDFSKAYYISTRVGAVLALIATAALFALLLPNLGTTALIAGGIVAGAGSVPVVLLFLARNAWQEISVAGEVKQRIAHEAGVAKQKIRDLEGEVQLHLKQYQNWSQRHKENRVKMAERELQSTIRETKALEEKERLAREALPQKKAAIEQETRDAIAALEEAERGERRAQNEKVHEAWQKAQSTERRRANWGYFVEKRDSCLLCLEGEEVYVNREILFYFCKRFSKFLEGFQKRTSRECGDGTHRVIYKELYDYRRERVEQLVKYLETGRCSASSAEEAVELFEIGRYIECKEFVDAVRQALLAGFGDRDEKGHTHSHVPALRLLLSPLIDDPEIRVSAAKHLAALAPAEYTVAMRHIDDAATRQRIEKFRQGDVVIKVFRNMGEEDARRQSME